MKRSSDEIQKSILKILEKGRKTNLESLRKQINTGLPTMLNNLKVLSNWGFVKLHESKFGQRIYREIELTKTGEELINRIKILKEKI